MTRRSGAQLEEKRIPYTVEKINMRCYGDKPPEYTRKVDAVAALVVVSAMIAAMNKPKVSVVAQTPGCKGSRCMIVIMLCS